MLMKTKAGVRNAVMIGSLCSLSYLAVYLARNVLGTVSPQMIENGVFSTANIGSLSSLYFITYAAGQLINGVVGDKIRAKYMISFGLVLSGVCSIVFTMCAATFWTAFAAYGLTGFFLSMIYGPMTKVVAENVEPMYTARCSLGYTLASFLGSPLAGVFAMVLAWQGVFYTSSAVLLGMGAICFLLFTVFEKKGVVRYGQYRREKQQGAGFKILLRHHIIRFTLISMVTGVVRTTVVFWLPTYLSQHLGFSAERAALIFTVSTFVISASAFVAVFVYERLGHNMNRTLLLFFICSTVGFALTFLIRQPVGNIIFLIAAIIAAASAAAMIWTRYCPGLRDTGLVSSVTGFLDFISYMSASVSSALFANAVSVIGWGGLILVWTALMAVGIVLCLPFGNQKL